MDNGYYGNTNENETELLNRKRKSDSEDMSRSGTHKRMQMDYNSYMVTGGYARA